MEGAESGSGPFVGKPLNYVQGNGILSTMKEHKGMRPQDIVVLLKITALGNDGWFNKDLSTQLGISGSEISESLNRSAIAGLIKSDKKTILKEPLLEFLVYGIKYVFPVELGSLQRGMPTAYSAPVLKDEFVVDDPYIWPSKEDSVKGVAIKPLYHTIPAACTDDPVLYNLLALTDAIRVGERKGAVVKKLAKTLYSAKEDE